MSGGFVNETNSDATTSDADDGRGRGESGGAGGGEGKVAMHSLLSLSWGFFSDVDIESESLRWLGGLRFTVQAVVRILFLRRYKARLRFRALPLNQESHPADDLAGVGAASTAERRAAVAATAAAVKGATAGASIPERPGWREISDDIQGLWALNVTWGAEDMHAAPGAKPGDGAYDIVVISGASRLSLLGLLLIFDGGGHVSHPAVTYIKASEFELDPGQSNTSAGGYLAVDGELIARATSPTSGTETATSHRSSGASSALHGQSASARVGGDPRTATGGLLANDGGDDSCDGSGECAHWHMPYGPMSLKVVRAAARVFGAAGGGGADRPGGNAV
uniref:YegS/DAGK C-terminal domain-containing protein n=2 Tax=Mantoniella antarctica TaxID=81844 RepID=A0A7S0SY97_9CHLO|mmetsp:Transcript_4192/g.10245  ORF Transcript_4192/g.10245 Transcript_4192/m.10245 type:complete len:336 (+) Transcript_4192:385-1392(+)